MGRLITNVIPIICVTIQIVVIVCSTKAFRLHVYTLLVTLGIPITGIETNEQMIDVLQVIVLCLLHMRTHADVSLDHVSVRVYFRVIQETTPNYWMTSWF